MDALPVKVEAAISTTATATSAARSTQTIVFEDRALAIPGPRAALLTKRPSGRLVPAIYNQT